MWSTAAWLIPNRELTEAAAHILVKASSFHSAALTTNRFLIFPPLFKSAEEGGMCWMGGDLKQG